MLSDVFVTLQDLKVEYFNVIFKCLHPGFLNWLQRLLYKNRIFSFVFSFAQK